MPKQLTAALVALLVAASTLAVVTASPAAAHPQTTTNRYCSYDPFAGQQCWTQKVPVAHHHPPPKQTCPAGTTGTPPNCAPIPSDNTNHDKTKTCPKGTTGTPPNCSPVPSDNSGTRTQPPPTTTTTAPPPTTQPPPKKCPPGKTGTPPNCQTEQEKNGRSSSGRGGQKNCATGQHRHNNGHDCTSGHTHDGSDDDGTGSGTPTNKTDPCGDYAEDLIKALNQPNSDGSYSLPDHPEGCSGASTREMLGRVRVFGADAGRLFRQAFEQAMKRQGEATENQGKMFDGVDELFKKLAKLWEETPNPAKAAALGVACFFLIPAEEGQALSVVATELSVDVGG